MAGIRFDGRVAVVTGAGGGLGRSHALLLAERGAAVVVNDLGGTRDGTGRDTASAERVAAEILARGGTAVANHDGVDTWEGGEAVVATALERFGRVDIVVNNAGILRDVTFGKLTREQLEPVLQVHLLGAFHVTRAAWNPMREQGYGRVICTTSGSGLYGNIGQAAYAAAKLGLVGLTRTLALEGVRYGITANAIAPLARSRMTEDVFPAAVLARLDPAYVSPLVAHLASEACQDTGHVYTVGGGHVARVAVVEGDGVVFDQVPSPEQLADRWAAIDTVGPDTEEITDGVFGQLRRLAARLGTDLG